MNSWLLKNLSMNDRLDVEFRIAVASQVLLCPRMQSHEHASCKKGQVNQSHHPLRMEIQIPPSKKSFQRNLSS